MVIGTGADLTVFQQLATLGFVYLAIKFIVWQKIFEYIGDLFKNKYTFGIILIAIIAAIIDPTLWETYFMWIAFIIDGLKSAVLWIATQALTLFGYNLGGSSPSTGWF